MASARRHQKLLEQTYRRLLADDLRRAPPSSAAEHQEADVLWGDHSADALPDPSRIGEKKRAPPPQVAAAAARSVPVDVPKWGREEESEGEGGEVVPPHVYLWRRRMATAAAAFSVEEGWGRTLKGRDLSRVRNAVWEKIGFAD